MTTGLRHAALEIFDNIVGWVADKLFPADTWKTINLADEDEEL